MARKFDITQTSLYERVYDLVNEGLWPFYTVRHENFLDASEQLLELFHCVDDRKLDGKKLSPEAYMDRTSEATISMLRCLQKMELEASSREMDSMLRWHAKVGYDMGFLEAQEFIEYATTELYSYNNRICDDLSIDLEEKGIRPRYIDVENKKTYVIDAENKFAHETTENHYNAMQEAYDEIDNLIKYGLPSERAIGKLQDKITGNDEHKEQNQTIVDKILRSEADLEVVMLYILPEIDLRIQEYYAKSIIEAQHYNEDIDTVKGEEKVSDPYYFRRGYQMYVDARAAISAALLKMQEKEKALESDYKLSIAKDPKTATYSITAEWGKGDKHVIETSIPVGKSLEKKSKVVTEKDRKERSVKIKVGQASHKLYEETRKRSAVKLGYMNRKELKGRKRGIANILSAQLLRREAMVRRQTAVAGKKEFETKVSFDPIKFDEKVVATTQQKDGQDKEKTLFGVSAGIGNVSASVEKKKVIPVAKASAKAAHISVEALGVAKAGISAGSIGYSTELDIAGQVKNTVFDGMIQKDDAKPIDEAFFEMAQGSLNKLHTVSINEPQMSAAISVSDITVMSTKTTLNNSEQTNIVPNIIDSFKNRTAQDVQCQEEAFVIGDR